MSKMAICGDLLVNNLLLTKQNRADGACGVLLTKGEPYVPAKKEKKALAVVKQYNTEAAHVRV